MSSASKYSRYIAVAIILVIAIYGVYNYYLDSSQRQGLAILINWGISSGGQQTVYDLSLPKDLNYTKLVGNGVSFDLPLNVSEYAKGTTPEQVIKEFSDKQSVRTWLGTVPMLNIVRNMLIAMFDMSKGDFDREFGFGFGWGADTRSPGFTSYSFSRTLDSQTNIITVKMGDAQSSITPQRCWELVMRIPFTGTDYDVTFTRMPKP